MLWRYLIRPCLFAFPAEPIHHFTMGSFSLAARIPGLSSVFRSAYSVIDDRLKVDALGREFANPIGLAAGFDKGAKWFNALALLGFSHIEVGTLTGQSQPGNPKPRLFRLPADRALINRMGFNNDGSQAAAERLARSAIRTTLGINIGKTKVVSLDEADDDYLLSFRRLAPFADYITVNVSSPNTPGLRQLQDREPLCRLLQKIQDATREVADRKPIPVLLKIAPDLNESQLDDIVEIASESGLAGIIATNTTISREGLKSAPESISLKGEGGLSGLPLTVRSRKMVRHLYRQLEGRIPIVGVGGIMNGDDAWQMICSGATLIQVYTGFIYGGPGFVKQLNRTLAKKLDQHGLSSIQDAIGREELISN